MCCRYQPLLQLTYLLPSSCKLLLGYTLNLVIQHILPNHRHKMGLRRTLLARTIHLPREQQVSSLGCQVQTASEQKKTSQLQKGSRLIINFRFLSPQSGYCDGKTHGAISFSIVFRCYTNKTELKILFNSATFFNSQHASRVQQH